MSKGKLAIRIVGVLVGLGLIYSSLVITPFGHRSVIWSVGGVSYEERESGLSFIFPLVQRSHQVDIREQRYVTIFPEGHPKAGEANAFVQSSDLQEISVRASLVYRVRPDRAAEVFDEIGPEYTERVVVPLLYDAIKEAGGRCYPVVVDEKTTCERTALSFAQELTAIADDVQEIIEPQLEERGIDVLSLALEDAVFDVDFILSVKEKVIAEQEAEEQRRLVAAEAAKKQQIELQAQAEEARAASLGLNPEQYLNWLWLQKWDGKLPTTLLSGGSEMILNLPS